LGKAYTYLRQIGILELGVVAKASCVAASLFHKRHQ